jgi:hypothetical protein
MAAGRPGRVLTNLAVVVGSTVLTLYAVEAVLVLTSPGSHDDRRRCRRVSEPDKCLAALAAGKPFDTRTKLELMRHLDVTPIDAWPSVSCTAVLDASVAAGGDVFPFGGISGVVTAYCNESGGYVLFDSDEHGFRNPPGLYDRRPDAVVIGDSFARGYCVDHDLAARLRDQLGSVVNLGIDDAGPLVELAALREIAALLKPRIVLWLFFEGNDLQDLEREKRRAELRRYLGREHRADLTRRQAEIDAMLRSFVRREERLDVEPWDAPDLGPGPVASFLMLDSLRHKLRRAAYVRAKPYPLDLALLRDVLLSARDETRAWGGELVFVYLPAWERFDGRRPNPHRTEILGLAEDLELPVVDLQEAFASHPDPLSLFPFRLRGHYTQEGYDLIAEAILRGVRDLANY